MIFISLSLVITSNVFSVEDLFAAIKEGNFDFCTEMIVGATNVNMLSSDGRLALNVVIDASQYDLAELMVDHGAEIDISDLQSVYPIYTAVKKRNSTFSKFLISRKANMNIKHGKGSTALQCAVRYGRKNALTVLLGAKAKTEDSGGHMPTLLILAIHFKRFDIAELLVSYGASIESLKKGYCDLLQRAAEGDRSPSPNKRRL